MESSIWKNEEAYSEALAVVASRFENYAKMVDEYLESSIKERHRGSPVRVDDALYGIIRYALKAGGKRIRPAMTMEFARLLGISDADIRNKVLPWACAVELIHTYLISMDDIMDGDRTRRGKQAVWTKYGLSLGLNASCQMLPMAYDFILRCDGLTMEERLELCETATLTLLKTGEGQAMDVWHRADPMLNDALYNDIIYHKTGYYFVFGLVGVAHLAKRDDLIPSLWELGKTLGSAFQAQDDTLDIVSPGKARRRDDGTLEMGCDIREGKPSLPYLLLLKALAEHGEEDKIPRVAHILAKPREQTLDADVEYVTAMYDQHDVIFLSCAKCDARVRDGKTGCNCFKDVPESERGFGKTTRLHPMCAAGTYVGKLLWSACEQIGEMDLRSDVQYGLRAMVAYLASRSK